MGAVASATPFDAGVIISAGPSDKVTLYGLEVNAAPNLGTVGVHVTSAGQVHIINCDLFGASQAGIRDARTAGGSRLHVKDTTVRDNGIGILIPRLPLVALEPAALTPAQPTRVSNSRPAARISSRPCRVRCHHFVPRLTELELCATQRCATEARARSHDLSARLLDEMSAHPIHTARRKLLDEEADAITSAVAELRTKALDAGPSDPVHRELKQAWERLADVQRDLMELDREERSVRASK